MRRLRPFRAVTGLKSLRLKSLSISVPVLLVLVALTLNACNLTSEEEDLPTSTPTTTQSASGRPRVVINSPTDGSTSPVNREILISVSATDSRGVTRIQLQANDRIVQTLTSENANGQTTFNAVLNHTPQQTGQLVLRVVAYRGSVASDPSEVKLTIGGANVPTSTVPPNVPTVPSIPTINPNDPTCRARANTALNVRSGPSTDTQILRVMGSGELALVVGRTGANDWWQVQISNVTGWVSAPFTTLYGSNCQSLPVIGATTTPPTLAVTTAAPPTTAPPTNTPTQADLIVTNLNGPTQLIVPAGGTITRNYSFTITNNGGDRTGQTVTSVRIIPGGQPITISTANLRGGESIGLNLDLTFTAAGNYRVEVAADAEGTVVEQSEVNNTGSINVVVTQ
jgi:uncharacterized protein YraI